MNSNRFNHNFIKWTKSQVELFQCHQIAQFHGIPTPVIILLQNKKQKCGNQSE